MKIIIEPCKKCGDQKSIGGMQEPWCKKCEPEKDPTQPHYKIYIEHGIATKNGKENLFLNKK